MNEARRKELVQVIRKMRAASDAFYVSAQDAGNHSFIEFTGLMNEYILLCMLSLDVGVDFTETNGHSGRALVAHPHNVRYLAEKLNCIFGPTLSSAGSNLRKTFDEELNRLSGDRRLPSGSIVKDSHGNRWRVVQTNEQTRGYSCVHLSGPGRNSNRKTHHVPFCNITEVENEQQGEEADRQRGAQVRLEDVP